MNRVPFTLRSLILLLGLLTFFASGYVIDEDDYGIEDNPSFPMIAFPPTANITAREAAGTHGSGLRVKMGRLDQVMDPQTRQWTYVGMAPNVTIENAPLKEIVKDSALQEFAFLVVRKLEPHGSKEPPSFRVILLHKTLVEICKKVVGTRPGLSWNQEPMEVDPNILVSHYDDFIKYRDDLKATTSEDSETLVTYLDQLLLGLEEDYTTTLSALKTMRRNGETTFEHLKYILKPRQLIYYACPITGLPRLCELNSFRRTLSSSGPVMELHCQGLDLVDLDETRNDANVSPIGVDRVEVAMRIPSFEGVVKMDSLPVHPFEYHPRRDQVEEEITRRGKKWSQLLDVRHMHYEGVAAFRDDYMVLRKQHVSGRIMIDRASFHKRQMNYPLPERVRGSAERKFKRGWDIPDFDLQGGSAEHVIIANPSPSLPSWKLTNDDLLLTPPVVYGFSLTDKKWLEFNVEKVSEIEWNDEAFPNLVIPSARKELLLSLIEAHSKQSGVDDFVRGKGQGLVINLFGPPGVGKTMSAEATSEHVRRPLFVVGSGDLGTDASTLDRKLERIFDLATTWKAIVLIDEADVFMEQRSLHELKRNAMVAVFLRHIEYYRGILFLTTNRVQTFDDAFISRIHIALYFSELDQSSRAKVWSAFIQKLRPTLEISGEELQTLAQRPANGRQIKNAVRTAQSLAFGRGERLRYEHLVETLQVMVEFNEEFKRQSARI